MPEANATVTTDDAATPAPEDAVVTWTDDDGVVHHGAPTSKAYLRSKEAEAAASDADAAATKSLEAAEREAAEQSDKLKATIRAEIVEQREQLKAEVRAELEAEAKATKSPNRGNGGTSAAPAPQV